MIRYTIDISGKGTPTEIVDALSEISEIINKMVDDGKEDELDSLSIVFPITAMNIKDHKIILTVKL